MKGIEDLKKVAVDRCRDRIKKGEKAVKTENEISRFSLKKQHGL
jgi:hypothetical protein